MRAAAGFKLVSGQEEGTDIGSQGIDKSFEKWMRKGGKRLGLGQRGVWRRVSVCLFDRIGCVEQVHRLKGRLDCGGRGGI